MAVLDGTQLQVAAAVRLRGPGSVDPHSRLSNPKRADSADELPVAQVNNTVGVQAPATITMVTYGRQSEDGTTRRRPQWWQVGVSTTPSTGSSEWSNPLGLYDAALTHQRTIHWKPRMTQLFVPSPVTFKVLLSCQLSTPLHTHWLQVKCLRMFVSIRGY
jgi:hypothetical protein